MGPRWLFGLASSVVLASVCGAAQQSGGQSDPWGGGAPGVSGVLGVPLNPPSTDVPSGSRRADEGKNLEFKSQTTLVEVPVVVTDKSGGHIHNLTKADFKVMEDGKEQRIASFSEITPVTDRLIVRPNPPGTVSNLRLEGQQPHSVTVIVLDTVNTPFLDQAYARGQLIKYLGDRLDSTQLLGLMVINSQGLKVLSDLTTDPASLIATRKKVGGEVSVMERFQTDSQAFAGTGTPPNGLLGGISPKDPPEAVFRKFILKADAVEGTYLAAPR